MNVNVIRLRSSLSYDDEKLVSENTNYLDCINDLLINDNIYLDENLESNLSVVFVETGGVESLFVNKLPELKKPIILISNEKNNSLPASLEIKTYCSLNDIACILLQGSEEEVSEKLRKILPVCNTVLQMQNKKLGLIGGPSDWLIASKMSKEDVKKVFGMDIIEIPMEELFEEIDKKEYGFVSDLAQLRKKARNQETLEGALYIYGALKRLVKKYDLNGLSIRCFDMLGKYRNTACLALGLLNEERIISACEGDIPSLITMYIIYLLTGKTSFQANPSKVDQEEFDVIFAHCTMPLNMCKNFSLDTHFESGLGIGIKGELALTDVTVCKLMFDKEKKLLPESLIASGTIKENLSLPNFCRTQINVHLNDYNFMYFMKNKFGNHVIITYSNIAEQLFYLVSLLDKIEIC